MQSGQEFKYFIWDPGCHGSFKITHIKKTTAVVVIFSGLFVLLCAFPEASFKNLSQGLLLPKEKY